MPTFGVQPTGFVKKLFDDIYTDIKARIVAVPGLARVNLGRESFVGGVVAAVAASVAELWDTSQELYSGFDASSASGRMLDNVAAMVGKYRKAATATTVVATVNLNAGSYGVGILVARAYGNPDFRFYNRDAITSVGGVSTAIFVCETTGALALPTATLTVIATPVPGWNSVTNLVDGIIGTETESDAELRSRRLVFSDADTLGLEPRVKRLTIIENVLDVPDGAGRPGHSFEAIVYDGTDTGTSITNAEIASLLWLSKPAGIATFGDITQNLVDSTGITRTVKFSRPTVLAIWLIVYVTKGIDWEDVSSVAAIKALLIDFNDKVHAPGSTVVRSSLFGPVMTVPTVFDVTNILLGLVNPPVGTANITTTVKQIPRFDTARISVVAV